MNSKETFVKNEYLIFASLLKAVQRFDLYYEANKNRFYMRDGNIEFFADIAGEQAVLNCVFKRIKHGDEGTYCTSIPFDHVDAATSTGHLKLYLAVKEMLKKYD